MQALEWIVTAEGVRHEKFMFARRYLHVHAAIQPQCNSIDEPKPWHGTVQPIRGD